MHFFFIQSFMIIFRPINSWFTVQTIRKKKNSSQKNKCPGRKKIFKLFTAGLIFCFKVLSVYTHTLVGEKHRGRGEREKKREEKRRLPRWRKWRWGELAALQFSFFFFLFSFHRKKKKTLEVLLLFVREFFFFLF